jgi:hypothetical protein
MHRQKKYYDQKLSWQIFQPGDQVFVFFPNVNLLPLFPRETQSAHFLLLEDFVDISFLSYPHVLLVVYLFDHS